MLTHHLTLSGCQRGSLSSGRQQTLERFEALTSSRVFGNARDVETLKSIQRLAEAPPPEDLWPPSVSRAFLDCAGQYGRRARATKGRSNNRRRSIEGEDAATERTRLRTASHAHNRAICIDPIRRLCERRSIRIWSRSGNITGLRVGAAWPVEGFAVRES